ncbi:acetate--CoA ligase [Nocardioides ungokensis]|uniref:acetate--CoA ligase n=1 Tax=Nocardioides ungokensis TaxID=1643322 RepID=UPI0015DDB3F7|nr:acetate--CoA ligase [Nocardioides ungokensis]
MLHLIPPTYEQLRRTFTWDRARRDLSGLPDGRGLNIAHEAVDRHVGAGLGHRAALRCVDEDGVVTTTTYEQLRRETNRFANVLADLGVERGDRVMTLLGRQQEQYVAALGTLKHGAVFSPLFSSFGPEPIRERLRISGARVLVTTPFLYRRKVAALLADLPSLEYVLVVGEPPDEHTLSLTAEMALASDDYEIAPTDPEDPALLHFTSGTTGRPKGAVHVHEAVVAHHATAELALDLRPGDVFWCTADPGWVTGTSYGIIAPLTHGATLISYAGEFDARAWYQLLEAQHVNVWYTAPTALRMLMKYGAGAARAHDLSTLRHIASVGEALNPEVVTWGTQAYGRPIHDNWWQTETGAIMVSNYAGMEIRPGSMGRPMPGVEAAVLVRGENGRARVVDDRVTVAGPGVTGELALRTGWPSMFRGYLGEEERYRACFADGWYLSGDLARVDEDGYFWFVGRADDVIKSAGHLIGPFEVETALMEHPAVVEAGVIGKPDAVAGELVKAFVTLRPGFEPDDALRRDLLAFGRHRLGGLAPKEIDFDQHLPHTSSGKVMRRLLKARELGLPEGDISTLENAP